MDRQYFEVRVNMKGVSIEFSTTAVRISTETLPERNEPVVTERYKSMEEIFHFWERPDFHSKNQLTEYAKRPVFQEKKFLIVTFMKEIEPVSYGETPIR